MSEKLNMDASLDKATSNEAEQIEIRREKRAKWLSSVTHYPNDYKPTHTGAMIETDFGALDRDALASEAHQVSVAGRIMMCRNMGKASFIHIQSQGVLVQIYVSKDVLGDVVYEDFLSWDIGDICYTSGEVFRTKTDALSIRAKDLVLLSKSLRPMPDKFHGLQDQELCYRRRYVDLMANLETREIFVMRSQIVAHMRSFFQEHGFMEVETPMMQVQPGGAIARPFITHHHALDMDLYMRVAPELYLKRLIVGGLERVFELNRNFRNEGLSTRHNPEFTMLEFYQAYADYRDLMRFTETLLQYLVHQVLGETSFVYQDHTIDFGKGFEVMSVAESVAKAIDWKKDPNDLYLPEHTQDLIKEYGLDAKLSSQKTVVELFEQKVEPNLISPTFITQYPVEISPLARRNQTHAHLTDRFELFIAGYEIANGFSELNDPEDQEQRFEAQLKEKQAGDHEAMSFDADYVMALEYGMPPTAGEGIGIDRLTMLLTNRATIKDVILFPTMRPKSVSKDSV